MKSSQEGQKESCMILLIEKFPKDILKEMTFTIISQDTTKGDWKMKQFEDLTIRELRIITKDYLIQNPDVPTVQELLDELNMEKLK